MDPARKQSATDNSQQLTNDSQQPATGNQSAAPDTNHSVIDNQKALQTDKPSASASILIPTSPTATSSSLPSFPTAPPSSPPPPPPPPPPTPPPTPAIFSASPPHHKFPFMIVTILIILIVAGFAVSFVFFNLTAPKKPAALPLVTPQVTILPSPNPTATVIPTVLPSPTTGLQNPSASPSAIYENPSPQATGSAETGN